MTKSPYTFISDRIISSLEWTEFKETAQWCKDNIYLSGDVSPYTGMMSFDKTPWIEDILNDWDKPWIEEYDIMASTQVGKTTIEFCCISKELDTDPCMMQLAIPNDNDVSNYIAKKLDPFLNGIKTLKSKLLQRRDEEKSRLKKATKEIPGGALFITGNTDTARRSNSVKNIFLDEVGLFGSGHVAELRGRTKFYEKTGRKIFIVSSRKYKGDEIELAYEGAYCKKELQIECKGCGKYFYPEGSKQFKFLTEEEYKKKHNLEKIEDRIKYKREARNTGIVECECGYGTTSKDIEDLVREKKVKLVIVEGSDEETRHGYKLNALATGLTNYSTIVEELIDATDDDEKLRTIYQDYFNEDYKIKHIEKEDSDMLLLGNGLAEYIVPKDTLAVYLTIDNQIDYLFAQITAIQYGMKVHIVYFGRIESWNDAENLWNICQNLEGEDGEQYMASYMGIDRRGYNEGQISRTEEADHFVDYMQNKWGNDRIYAMEGHPDLSSGQPFIIRNQKDMSNQRYQLDIKIVKFSNVYIKHKLFKWIDRTIAYNKAEEGEEPRGYDDKMIFINQDNIERDRESVTDLSITRMLTAEVWGYEVDKKTNKKAKKESYFKIRARNDAIDTTDMALVFAEKDKLSHRQKPENIDIKQSLDRLGSI